MEEVSAAAWIPLALGLVAALTSIVTTIVNIGALNRATKGNEAQVFLGLSQRYLSPEIRDGLRTLDRFYLDNRDAHTDMGEAWVALMKANPAAGEAVRLAAREVCLYFVNLGRMYEARLVSRRLVKALLNTPGTSTFYDVACPIQVAWIPDSVAPHYRAICRKVVPKFGAGLDNRGRA